MGRRKKDKYSTKQDNVPHDDELRRKMIEAFIQGNEADEECFQVFETMPYDSNQMIRSTAGSKGRKSNK